MCKRFVGLVLVLVIFASIITIEELTASVWDWDPEISNVTEEEFWQNWEVSIRQLQALHWEFEPPSSIAFTPPDFYAGVHIDADGLLVINIVESRQDQARSYTSIRSLLDTGVQYRYVEFSLAELRTAQSAMWEVIDERRVPRNERRRRGDWCRYTNYIADNVSMGYVCAMSNRSIVGLNDYDDVMIARFRRYVYDAPMVMFEQQGFLYMNGQGSILFSVIILVAIFMVIVIGVIIVIRRRMFKPPARVD